MDPLIFRSICSLCQQGRLVIMVAQHEPNDADCHVCLECLSRLLTSLRRAIEGTDEAQDQAFSGT